jgi:hypothetical protein
MDDLVTLRLGVGGDKTMRGIIKQRTNGLAEKTALMGKINDEKILTKGWVKAEVIGRECRHTKVVPKNISFLISATVTFVSLGMKDAMSRP